LYENSDGLYSCFDNENGDSGRSSGPVLRFAIAYGFKNVQLMLQRLSKTEATKCYDYVEIMACPSGCSNGGGQIGANGHRETPRETKERVRKTVSTVPIVRPANNHDCGSYASRISGCNCFDDTSRQLFHTHFHVVPKLELSTGATAGVALSDTKW
jgi:iron only hydrogenase large subunit-like protein